MIDFQVTVFYLSLSYAVTSGSEIMSCIKSDKPLVVYGFCNVMSGGPYCVYNGKIMVFSRQNRDFKVVF